MAKLNWAFREELHCLKPQGRLPILLALYLHCNLRLRAYPSNDILAKETGVNRVDVSRSIQWLQDNGAVVLVPYANRIEDEIDLPRRKHIYQLTGVLQTKERVIEYLYLSQEEWISLSGQLRSLPESKLALRLLSLRKPSLHKVVTVVKDNTEPKDKKTLADTSSDVPASEPKPLTEWDKLEACLLAHGIASGGIKYWLQMFHGKAKASGYKVHNTHFQDNPLTADEFNQAMGWYDTETNATRPTNREKLVKWLVAYRLAKAGIEAEQQRTRRTIDRHKQIATVKIGDPHTRIQSAWSDIQGREISHLMYTNPITNQQVIIRDVTDELEVNQ